MDNERLKLELGDDYAYAVKNDSIASEYAREIFFYHGLLQLHQAITHPSLYSIPLDSLRDLLPICSVSPDGRVISYCLDEAHGGTYLSMISALQIFHDKKNKCGLFKKSMHIKVSCFGISMQHLLL